MVSLPGCTRKPLCRLLTHLVVFVAYLCIGAALFQVIEGPEEDTLVADLKDVRAWFSDISHDCVSGNEEKIKQKIM
jgi:hypothetical protein